MSIAICSDWKRTKTRGRPVRVLHTYSLRTYQLHQLKPYQTAQMGRLSRREGLLSQALSDMLHHQRLKREQEWHRFIIAETADGIIVGWALLRELVENESNELMMYVHQSFRRQGIGTAMANRAKLLHSRSDNWDGRLRVHIMEDQGNFYKTVGLK